jgi:hypothetical protein
MIDFIANLLPSFVHNKSLSALYLFPTPNTDEKYLDVRKLNIPLIAKA